MSDVPFFIGILIILAEQKTVQHHFLFKQLHEIDAKAILQQKLFVQECNLHYFLKFAYKSFEKELSVMNITMCRQRAEVEFHRLGKKRAKEKAEKGWFGGWFGGGKKPDEKKEAGDLSDIAGEKYSFGRNAWISRYEMFNVMAEWIRAPDSSSGVSVQQIVGSNPGRDTCVLKQDT